MRPGSYLDWELETGQQTRKDQVMEAEGVEEHPREANNLFQSPTVRRSLIWSRNGKNSEVSVKKATGENA